MWRIHLERKEYAAALGFCKVPIFILYKPVNAMQGCTNWIGKESWAKYYLKNKNTPFAKTL